MVMSAGDHYLSYKASYAHVQGAHGPISRCGRQAMAKYALFVTLVAGAERILRPVFRRFRGILSLYKSLRGLDRPNWRFSFGQQR